MRLLSSRRKNRPRSAGSRSRISSRRCEIYSMPTKSPLSSTANRREIGGALSRRP